MCHEYDTQWRPTFHWYMYNEMSADLMGDLAKTGINPLRMLWPSLMQNRELSTLSSRVGKFY